VTAVGVLALQGAVREHELVFERLGVETRRVRTVADLEGLTHLVLPGGESTTLQRLMALGGLWEAIPERHASGELVLFGTCAGAILLGHVDGAPPTWGVLDATLERNAYGPQVHSGTKRLRVEGESRSGEALFIRAPRIVAVGPDASVIASVEGKPVALAGPGLLATTFHPELGSDTYFHGHFLAVKPAFASERTPCP